MSFVWHMHVPFSQDIAFCLCFGTELEPTCRSIGTFYPQGWILEVLHPPTPAQINGWELSSFSAASKTLLVVKCKTSCWKGEALKPSRVVSGLCPQANHYHPIVPSHPQASKAEAIRVEPWLKNIVVFMFPNMCITCGCNHPTKVM